MLGVSSNEQKLLPVTNPVQYELRSGLTEKKACSIPKLSIIDFLPTIFFLYTEDSIYNKTLHDMLK